MAAKNKKARKGASAKKQRKSREGSVAETIRTLIAKGHTNEAIYAALSKRKLLNEAKRHWPQWYRRQMILDGEIKRTFAEQHAHAEQ